MVKTSASGIFGVIKDTFFINLFFKILIALLSINLAPLLAIITGSKIIFEILILFNALITELITFEECNMPIFMASGLMSLDVKII